MVEQDAAEYEVVPVRRPWWRSQGLALGLVLLVVGLPLTLWGAEDGAGLFGIGLLFFGVIITAVGLLRAVLRPR